MSSVTQRIKEIKQPVGGYIKPSSFKCIEYDDGRELFPEENVHGSIVGLVVDYMTRFLMGASLADAFNISLMGAALAERCGRKGSLKEIDSYLSKIKGLDKKSIIYACKIVTFDVWYRSTSTAFSCKTAKETNADDNTVNNIMIMLERSLEFWDEYGPITVDGFTFEGGGYTDTVNAGDGDYLTEDTLWDFKVSKNKPKSDHTLQLLMYYLMGRHSGKEEFDYISKLGIFNPRTNTVYLKEIEDIPYEIIEDVSLNVIGYSEDQLDEIVVTDEEIDNEYEEEEEVNYLDMTDIMKVLKCSRYMVMKMYNTQGLPLVKINNKYYISEEDFYNWMEDQRKKREWLITFIILALIFYFIFLFWMLHR